MNSWAFNEYDHKVIKELQEYLPRNIFDMHAHVYHTADLNIPGDSPLKQGPQAVTAEVWFRHIKEAVGGRCLAGGLLFPMPTMDLDINSANGFLIRQLKKAPNSKGLVIVHPDNTPEEIARFTDCSNVAGFKPYCVFSKEKPFTEATISSYLPESVWEIANEREYVIMLHIVRRDALADPENQNEIRKMCLKYPQVKLILAHAGKGFHAPNTVKGLPYLKGIDNLWFDTSAICEPTAISAIIRELGPEKVLWGSDFPISQRRGKCITMGDGFAWLQEDFIHWEKLYKYAPGCCHPVMFVLESTRTLLEAAVNAGLEKADIENMFYYNALKLLNINTPV